ncbi:uncharacterized protein N7529_001013 [Penicillium soppii]|jgi:hypothetical protein|uniref:uncharacterized protein n=1 Tax=Penicillium soppii TaxID=69789 RepID=UPI0025497469|nr:uncharacterized protein N7529_001013 [Penicillium soppii]KAJ5882341.1 hypothetical protein N7529_001013 [Penicillium soppii]
MPENAQTRALAIPEIVSSILQQMDMRTLITAQKISRTWKDLICNTQSLQETLFFRPISHDYDISARVNNPLLAEAFPSVFPLQDRDNAEEQWISLTDLTWEKNAAVRKMFIRPEASWRRMLTHQPPLYRVGGFESNCTPFGWNWSQKRATVPEDGLRMAPLFEYLMDRLWEDWAYAESIEIFFPASFPAGFLESKTFQRLDGADSACKEMMGQFDLVLDTSSSTTCTAEDDYEEAQEEMEKEAKEKGVKLPDTDVTIWKRICECYREFGLEMKGFQMEEYNEGSGAWD